MLYALQQELVSSTMVEMVSIRQREIDLLSKQARGLAFLFAVIASARRLHVDGLLYVLHSSRIFVDAARRIVRAHNVCVNIPTSPRLWRCMLLMAFAPFSAPRPSGRPRRFGRQLSRGAIQRSLHARQQHHIRHAHSPLLYARRRRRGSRSSSPGRRHRLVRLAGGDCWNTLRRFVHAAMARRGRGVRSLSFAARRVRAASIGPTRWVAPRRRVRGQRVVGATPSTLSVAAGLFDRDASEGAVVTGGN